MVSTVKLDADEYDAGLADLRFCFRIISPTSRLTLQAESDEDRAAWVAALQGRSTPPSVPSYALTPWVVHVVSTSSVNAVACIWLERLRRLLPLLALGVSAKV